ncbi:hypothetical protein Axi01nite_54060 [Actinoplanes xinjiangensis]|nr:hypothetical protein Axi01nite_54060 [Actinoplanes xinjiangensis]
MCRIFGPFRSGQQDLWKPPDFGYNGAVDQPWRPNRRGLPRNALSFHIGKPSWGTATPLTSTDRSVPHLRQRSASSAVPVTTRQRWKPAGQSERRFAAAAASRSSTPTVASQPMQASVTDWP